MVIFKNRVLITLFFFDFLFIICYNNVTKNKTNILGGIDYEDYIKGFRRGFKEQH